MTSQMSNSALAYKNEYVKRIACYHFENVNFFSNLYFGSPHIISVWRLLKCEDKLILLPARDNLSSQGISVCQEKLDTFKEVRGRWHIPSAGYCFQELNDKQI